MVVSLTTDSTYHVWLWEADQLCSVSLTARRATRERHCWSCCRFERGELIVAMCDSRCAHSVSLWHRESWVGWEGVYWTPSTSPVKLHCRLLCSSFAVVFMFSTHELCIVCVSFLAGDDRRVPWLSAAVCAKQPVHGIRTDGPRLQCGVRRHRQPPAPARSQTCCENDFSSACWEQYCVCILFKVTMLFFLCCLFFPFGSLTSIVYYFYPCIPGPWRCSGGACAWACWYHCQQEHLPRRQKRSSSRWPPTWLVIVVFFVFVFVLFVASHVCMVYVWLCVNQHSQTQAVMDIMDKTSILFTNDWCCNGWPGIPSGKLKKKTRKEKSLRQTTVPWTFEKATS